MANLIFRTAGRAHGALYKLGAARTMLGVPLLILTTRGRRSGRDVETPLMYFEDGADLFLIASKGGSPTHPAWYLNLLAHSEVGVRIGNRTERRRAEPVSDRAERDRLFARAAEAYGGYAEYQKKTERLIPVVRLRPEAATAS